MSAQSELFCESRERLGAGERVHRMQEGAQRKRDAIARARAVLAEARKPYDEAASELLDLMARGAPKDQERAARRRMWGRASACRRGAARAARRGGQPAMTVIVHRAVTRPRRAQGCSRCGQPRAAHARWMSSPRLSTASFAGAPSRGPGLDDSGGTR